MPAALFDHRWDGTHERSLIAICLPHTQSLLLFSLAPGDDNLLKVIPVSEFPAIAVASLRMTRNNVWDLLILKPDHHLAILTHGTYELPLQFKNTTFEDYTCVNVASSPGHGKVVSLQAGSFSSVVVGFEDGWNESTVIDLVPQDDLTCRSLQILALTLPSDIFFALHQLFLEIWSSRNLSRSYGVEFECFTEALYTSFGLPLRASQSVTDPWINLGRSTSHDRFCEDPVLKDFETPPKALSFKHNQDTHKPHTLLALVLYALHTLGEDLRLMVHQYHYLLSLAPVICRIASAIRPEWADYWKRLCPHVVDGWPNADAGCASLLCVDGELTTDFF